MIPIQWLVPEPHMVHQKLFWCWVLLMVADMTTGYMVAAIKGAARSDRFLTGLAKRLYLVLMVSLISIIASVMPDTFTIDTVLGPITAPNVIISLAILGELKSLLERAYDLGLGDHPVLAPIARWIKRGEVHEPSQDVRKDKDDAPDLTGTGPYKGS